MASVIPLVREKSSRRSIAPGHRRVAAIDIGSNSIRGIIADVSSEGAIQVIDEMKAAPRLAAGLGASILTMVGAGGVERRESHVAQTAALIMSLDPRPGDFVFLLDANELRDTGIDHRLLPSLSPGDDAEEHAAQPHSKTVCLCR